MVSTIAYIIKIQNKTDIFLAPNIYLSMLKTFTTHLYAINRDSQELKRFDGLKILARSWEEAEHYCATNDLGYLVVDGELDGEYKEGNMVKVLGSVSLN